MYCCRCHDCFRCLLGRNSAELVSTGLPRRVYGTVGLPNLALRAAWPKEVCRGSSSFEFVKCVVSGWPSLEKAITSNIQVKTPWDFHAGCATSSTSTRANQHIETRVATGAKCWLAGPNAWLEYSLSTKPAGQGAVVESDTRVFMVEASARLHTHTHTKHANHPSCRGKPKTCPTASSW